MALPKQLKTARMTTGDLGNTIPTNFGAMESSLADILGLTVDSDVTASALQMDNSGRLTKTLIEQLAAGPVGWRFRDVSTGNEMRIALSGSLLTIDQNTGTELVPVWATRFSMNVSTGALNGYTFSATNPGFAPASGLDPTKFLAADGTYSVPAAVSSQTASVALSGVQSIPDSTFTALSLATVNWNVGGMYSAGQPTRFTFQSAGKYLATGYVGISANANGRRIVDIRQNGATPVNRSECAPNGSNTVFTHLTAIVNAAVNDYIELTAWQNSGSTLSINAGTFAVYKIGG